MGDFTPKTNHVAEGLSRLLAQFKGMPRMEALLASYLDEVQELDDAAAQLADERFISSGVGVQLDGIGAIVGEERQGISDAEYRAFIRARVRVNRSNGKLVDLLLIVALIQDDTSIGAVGATEFYPASVALEAVNEMTVNAFRVNQMLQQAKPGGVSLHLTFTKAPRANTLLFDDGANPGAVTGDQSFGDGQDDPPNNGGAWPGVFA